MRTILDGRRDQRVNPPSRGGLGGVRYQVSFNAPHAAGDQTWTCPRTGEYTIYAWGRGGTGGTGNPGGGSGALAIWQRVRFSAGDVVTISVPSASAQLGSLPDTTVATPRKAAVLTAGCGANGTGVGGVAANGDVNINGSTGAMPGTAGANGGGTDGGLGVADSGGAGAPGYDGFRGGDAATSSAPASTPGGGGAGSGDSTRPQFYPGTGLVIICRDK